MTQRLMTSALFAGFAAALLAALLHFALVQNLILEAETYETGAATHFGGLADPVAAKAGADHGASGTEAHAGAAAPGADSPADDAGGALSRNMLTVLFATLVYVGYALLMVAGFGIAASFGIRIGLREGLLWGIAGFVAFQLAPAVGLTPGLPGTPAADVTDRQLWWVGTVLATGVGLALIGFGRRPPYLVAGLVLIVLPHLIGAPRLDGYGGAVPPELAAAFATRVLVAGMVVWAALGAMAGWFWNRDAT